jgi:hypothetical protein
MGLVAYLICTFGDWTVAGNTIEKSLLLGLTILNSLGIYLICSYGMKNDELFFLMEIVKRKGRQLFYKG